MKWTPQGVETTTHIVAWTLGFLCDRSGRDYVNFFAFHHPEQLQRAEIDWPAPLQDVGCKLAQEGHEIAKLLLAEEAMGFLSDEEYVLLTETARRYEKV